MSFLHLENVHSLDRDPMILGGKNNWWAHDRRTAQKEKKWAHNGRAPTKFCFFSHFFPKSPMGATNCEQVQKQKKSMDKLPMIFFLNNGSKLKKKNWRAHAGRGAHEIQKTKWATQKKNSGQRLFFSNTFFWRPGGIPRTKPMSIQPNRTEPRRPGWAKFCQA